MFLKVHFPKVFIIKTVFHIIQHTFSHSWKFFNRFPHLSYNGELWDNIKQNLPLSSASSVVCLSSLKIAINFECQPFLCLFLWNFSEGTAPPLIMIYHRSSHSRPGPGLSRSPELSKMISPLCLLSALHSLCLVSAQLGDFNNFDPIPSTVARQHFDIQSGEMIWSHCLQDNDMIHGL